MRMIHQIDFYIQLVSIKYSKGIMSIVLKTSLLIGVITRCLEWNHKDLIASNAVSISFFF